MSATQQYTSMSYELTLHAIHECVYGSTIRHILGLPVPILIEYLATFPFYRGADTLYYFLLKRVGAEAHYASDGRHLVIIHPELIGVYILAEQNLKAPIYNHTDYEKTIYPMIKANIDRTIICPRYQMRHSIIIGEAPFEIAINIPSIALNIPVYQTNIQTLILNERIILILVENDCLEPIKSLSNGALSLILNRMNIVKASFPNLWNLTLKQYYSDQLARLKIHDYLPDMAVRQLTMLNTLLPELIQLPPDLDTIGIRLWFSPRSTRAYLLGFDILEGIPSDEIVSEKLKYLKEIGIERYADEITGVYIDTNNKLTGQIGIMKYPNLVGKTLTNFKDTTGAPIGVYYPHDLYPIVSGENVTIVTRADINRAVTSSSINVQSLQNILTPRNIPTLKEIPTEETLKIIFDRLLCPIIGKRGVPARIRLVETMSWDLLKY